MWQPLSPFTNSPRVWPARRRRKSYVHVNSFRIFRMDNPTGTPEPPGRHFYAEGVRTKPLARRTLRVR
jgi:hypothetical protein